MGQIWAEDGFFQPSDIHFERVDRNFFAKDKNKKGQRELTFFV
jgi:hypothetical protein